VVEADEGRGSGGFPVVYLLIDTSGSTVLHNVNLGCNRALPEMVAAIETNGGASARLGLVSYGTDAVVCVPLTAVADLTMIPVLPAAGLSSMAAGFRLLAETIAADCEQLAADALRHADPTVVVIVDGLPTDNASEVLAARDLLDVVRRPPRVHVVAPVEVDALALNGLRATAHQLDTGEPQRIADSLVSVVRAVVSEVDR
jgi:uncharacterized protein YegL